MAERKTKKAEKEKKVVGKLENSDGAEICKDKLCPIHGSDKLKLRGRRFQGTVVKKLHGRVKIEFERLLYDRKYERYEKRKTNIHARLPDCLNEEVEEGDYIEVAETRPISKTIHCVVVKVVRKKMIREKSE